MGFKEVPQGYIASADARDSGVTYMAVQAADGEMTGARLPVATQADNSPLLAFPRYTSPESTVCAMVHR